MTKLKFCICLAFVISMLGCGETAKDTSPKVVGEPKNTKFATPASDGSSGASANVNNDKTIKTP
jgi:hypothetical protein